MLKRTPKITLEQVIARRAAGNGPSADPLREAREAMTDEQITAAALADPDNPPLTDAEIAEAQALVRAGRVGRPPLHPDDRKRQVTLRLPGRIIDHYRAGGPGWMVRMEEVLDRAIKDKK